MQKYVTSGGKTISFIVLETGVYWTIYRNCTHWPWHFWTLFTQYVIIININGKWPWEQIFIGVVSLYTEYWITIKMRLILCTTRQHIWTDFPDNAHPKTFANARAWATSLHANDVNPTNQIWVLKSASTFQKKIGAKMASVQLRL